MKPVHETRKLCHHWWPLDEAVGFINTFSEDLVPYHSINYVMCACGCAWSSCWHCSNHLVDGLVVGAQVVLCVTYMYLMSNWISPCLQELYLKLPSRQSSWWEFWWGLGGSQSEGHLSRWMLTRHSWPLFNGWDRVTNVTSGNGVAMLNWNVTVNQQCTFTKVILWYAIGPVCSVNEWMPCQVIVCLQDWQQIGKSHPCWRLEIIYFIAADRQAYYWSEHHIDM